MIVNTRTGQGPAPCTYPCNAETAVSKTDDQVEVEVRHARVAIISQLLHEHSQAHEVDPERIRELLIERFPELSEVKPQQLRNAISWVTGFIGQGVAQVAVTTLVDDPRDFNDLVDAYEHRVDPAAFTRHHKG